MAQPKYRLSLSNKDKSLRNFTDYKGNAKESRYQTIGAIFESEDGRLSCAIDKKVTIDPATTWLNIYVVEPRDSDDEDEKPKAKKAAKSKVKKQTKKTPPPDDETDPFADDE